MPVNFDQKSELKSEDYFKSEQFEDSEDEELCILPPILKQQKIDAPLTAEKGADQKITALKRLDTHTSFKHDHDEFEVPQKMVHRGSFGNFMV